MKAKLLQITAAALITAATAQAAFGESVTERFLGITIKGSPEFVSMVKRVYEIGMKLPGSVNIHGTHMSWSSFLNYPELKYIIEFYPEMSGRDLMEDPDHSMAYYAGYYDYNHLDTVFVRRGMEHQFTILIHEIVHLVALHELWEKIISLSRETQEYFAEQAEIDFVIACATYMENNPELAKKGRRGGADRLTGKIQTGAKNGRNGTAGIPGRNP